MNSIRHGKIVAHHAFSRSSCALTIILPHVAGRSTLRPRKASAGLGGDEEAESR